MSQLRRWVTKVLYPRRRLAVYPSDPVHDRHRERSRHMSSRVLMGAILSASLALGAPSRVAADDAAEISKDAQAALASLYAKVDGAKALGAKATAILVFPSVKKAGFG